MNSTNTLKPKPVFLYLLLIGLAFFLVYYKLLNSSFISWDDTDYVLENKDVHQFNFLNFFSKFYIGNYHPITMLNYAMDWKLFGKSPFGYHLENIVWHFVNTLLVYVFCQKLLKNDLKSFIIAVVFSFHPTQLETVAWIAERKNLLASFFLLNSLILYLQFLGSKKNSTLLFTFLLFVLALLCKPSAIIFPFLLFTIDYYYNQPFTKKTIIQKVPFLVLSLLFSFITFKAQQSGKFINESHAFPIYERIGYAGYAIFQYLYKFIIPVNLSVIYPYPTNKIGGIITGYTLLIIIGLLVYKLYQSKKHIVLFGLLFFFINLLLVLQFIPFGEVITADRYMYLPIIGISVILVSITSFYQKQLKIIGIVSICILGSLSFLRTSVWKNSLVLFTDTLKKQPHSFVVLNSLGAEYLLSKNYNLAYNYLNLAINENINYYKGYYNRGLLFAQTNKIDKALQDFNKAIDLKKYSKAYVARANIYYILKDFPKAIADAELILKTEPDNVKANFVLATCFDDINQLDRALTLYNKTILLHTDDPMYFMRRAILFGKKQNYEACLNDLNTCINLSPNFAEAYYWKGVVKVNLKQNPCGDLKTAVDLGFITAQQSLNRYCK